MNLTLKNISFMFIHNRNVLIASLYNEQNQMVRNDQLSALLMFCQKNNYTITNAQDVLNDIVLKHGFTA